MTYNKTYSDPHESTYRKKVFMENVRKIDELNHTYRNRRLMFTCAINSYTDLTSTEFVSKFAGFRMSKIVTQPEFSVVSRPPRNVSVATVDWRPLAVTPVKQQVAPFHFDFRTTKEINFYFQSSNAEVVGALLARAHSKRNFISKPRSSSRYQNKT